MVYVYARVLCIWVPLRMQAGRLQYAACSDSSLLERTSINTVSTRVICICCSKNSNIFLQRTISFFSFHSISCAVCCSCSTALLHVWAAFALHWHFGMTCTSEQGGLSTHKHKIIGWKLPLKCHYHATSPLQLLSTAHEDLQTLRLVEFCHFTRPIDQSNKHIWGTYRFAIYSPLICRDVKAMPRC